MIGGHVDHAARLAAFARGLSEAGISAALISQPQDLYYLSGTAQPCNLVVVPGGEPTLIARRFAELARRESAVERVIEGGGFAAVVRELERHGVTGGRLGLELDVVPATLYRKAVAAFATFEVVDCAPILLAQRAIKDATEIAAMRAAAALYEAVHDTMAAHLRAGVAEHELAGEVLRALRRAGHAGLVAQRRWDAALQPEGQLASGPNLAVMSGGPMTVSGVGLSRAVPFGASARRIRQGDLVNIDLGLNLDGYHADMARTYVLGEPSHLVVEMARVVRAVQDACLEAVRPGAIAGDVHAAGLGAARELGVAEIFQGFGGEHGPYVGHGIGLELDEPPVLGPGVTTVLRAGMVLALEPKLLSPRFGAVNLEDDVVVTDGGCEVLGTVPRAVFGVQADGSLDPIL
ncbi:MAG: hypothetical protein QOI62_3038 [Solirubrobacteraceae bacterium]|nr:hypothetical protein [Solirubrobacteraceae bacterium]MEA2359778.1 hypothetical protein [Solirubrobacteraceae bacterium]